MKLYTKQDLIDLVESLKNYTHESHSILGHDEREAKEFVDIFLKNTIPIELPTDEEMEERAERNISPFSFIDGAKWMRDKIQGGNK